MKEKFGAEIRTVIDYREKHKALNRRDAECAKKNEN